MAGESILIFDADPSCRAAALACLSDAGYRAAATASMHELSQQAAAARHELLLIDWDLPGVAGTDLIDSVRRWQGDPELRLMILSRLASESDVVTGLEVGADDYLTKPYSSRELLARVGVLLRGRRHRERHDQLRVGALLLDQTDGRAYVGDQVVAMRGAQLRLLAYLMTHRERALQRAHLLEAIWGQAAGVDERTVDVNVRRLRQVLAGVGLDHYVQTVREVGYRLSARPG
jgi:two-component system phosphate regulon response regulator PhoB